LVSDGEGRVDDGAGSPTTLTCDDTVLPRQGNHRDDGVEGKGGREGRGGGGIHGMHIIVVGEVVKED
jgi:hypothetical protein